MKNTVQTFQAAKGGEKLALLTAYDYTVARIMDQCGINGILVGDSLGMVCLGHKNTLAVEMEDMIRHCAAVARGVETALLICDLPFMSYQCGIEQAVENAGRLIKYGGAEAVKLEGGEYDAEIRAICRAGIPVMGHIGLTPQSVNAIGGYKVQGTTELAAQKIMDAAQSIEAAGAFALVLECVPRALAKAISQILTIPVIGIGAGPECDGQVLVWQDMLGLGLDKSPKFVRQFAQIGAAMRDAFNDYVIAVKAGAFPEPRHCYDAGLPQIEDQVSD